jgi:hypothetical protein
LPPRHLDALRLRFRFGFFFLFFGVLADTLPLLSQMHDDPLSLANVSGESV